MRPMNKQFVLGLIAGEGCFSINFTRTPSYTYGIQLRQSFTLGMNEENEELVKAISEKLNESEIGTHQDGHIRLEIRRHEAIDSLIEYIESADTTTFEKSEKYESYRKWRDLWGERDELLKNVSGVKEYVRRGKNINSDDGRRGRSAEEICEIIDEHLEENPRHKRHSKELFRDVYESHDEEKQVAEELAILAETVAKYRKKYNITPHHEREIPKERVEDVASNCNSINEIANELEVGWSTAKKLTEKHGIQT